MKKYIKRLIVNFVTKRFPKRLNAVVRNYTTVYVKKGKIREWRTFDVNGVRMANVIK